MENARAGAVFLREDCGGDDELRREVESLIVSAREGDSIEPFYREAMKVMAGEQSEPFVGRVLGRYRVIRKVGAGGMGEVYQAQDTHLPRKVALKLLPAAFTQDVDRLRRFRQEAYAASALNHPNIITVYEVGELDGQHFIATEFIEGQTLRERMTRSGMGLDETLDITIQIAAGLDAAHKSGIVHRDVKPENVIVRPDGLVKILDFGLAKLEAPKAPTYDSQTLTIIGMGTEPGTMMGTVNYMSPEQARGQKVDGRSDIFSLGVMLYELIAGKRPFDGETSSDVIAAILKTEPPPLRLCSPALPEKLERTVSKALRKNREERYPLINDLLADLKGIQQVTVLETRLARGHLQERHQGGKCKTVNQEITEAYKEFPLRSEEADIVSTKATGHPTVSTARRYLLNVKGAAAGRRVSCSLIVSVTASLMVAFGSYIFFRLGSQAPRVHSIPSSSPPPSSDVYDSLVFSGQLRKARELSRGSLDLAERDNRLGVAATIVARNARAEALFGNCQQAQMDTARALAFERNEVSLVYGATALALCGEAARARSLADELVRQNLAAPISTFWLPLIQAAIEIHGGDPAQAIQLLQNIQDNLVEPEAPYWAYYFRGQAYLKQRAGVKAAAEFQNILSRRELSPLSPLYPLSYIQLARALLLTRDRSKSRRAYQDFFALWENADPDLPILIEAKKEYKMLK